MYTWLQEEGPSGEETASADFSHQIDAGIVRILKRQSPLHHQDLFVALVETLKTPVEASLIKKRLANLIDREYIARDPSDAHSYRYVA